MYKDTYNEYKIKYTKLIYFLRHVILNQAY